MSREKINLCSFVLSEYYGPICEKVGVYLLKNGPCPIKLIANNCDLKLNQVLLFKYLIINLIYRSNYLGKESYIYTLTS